MSDVHPKFTIVTDYLGVKWRVTEARETVIGVTLFSGFPLKRRDRKSVVILTNELVDIFEQHRHPGGVKKLAAALLISESRVTGLRRKLGHIPERRSESWWQERLDDLENLTSKEFAEKHAVNHSVVAEKRKKLIGLKYRTDDWWQERLEDLATMTGAEFEKKHAVHRHSVSKKRIELLGHRVKLDAWWKDHLDDLERLTGSQFAKKYGVSAPRVAAKRKQLLGLRSKPDEWWQERFGDLVTLTSLEFSQKHSVPPSTVSDKRKAVTGRRLRPVGWWQDRRIRELIESDRPIKEIADMLSVSVSVVYQIRWAIRNPSRKRDLQRKHSQLANERKFASTMNTLKDLASE